MNKIAKIRKRINKNREKQSLKKDILELENKSHPLYKIAMMLLGIYAIFIAFALYVRNEERATTFNTLFNTNIDFSSFNKAMGKVINLRGVDSKITSSDQMVSASVSYQSLGDDYYTSDDHLIVAFDDGVVTYVNGKDDNYTVIVEFDRGYRATFNGVMEVNAYVGDRVYQNDIIGSFDDKVQIIFIKNREKVSYEEILEFN